MDDIKNRVFTPYEYKQLTNALLNQGFGTSGGPSADGSGMQLAPMNMGIADLDAAQQQVKQMDATSNILGALRQDAGQDPVVAQNDANVIAEKLQDPTYKQGMINKFQMPTKDEKKAKKKAMEKKAEREVAKEAATAPTPIQPDRDTTQDLLASQATSNENSLIANMLKATNRINEAGNLSKVSDDMANDLQKQANLPVENFKLGQENKKSDLAINKAQAEFNNEKALNDPASYISKLTRDSMSKLGYTIPEGVSAGVLKQSGVNVGTLLGIKETNDSRKEIAKMMSEQKKDSAETSAKDKAAKAAKLSDKQTTELTSLDTALDAIDTIIAQKPKYATSKLDALGNKIGQAVNMDDPEYSAFQAMVGEQLAQYIKSISGAAVSAYERQQLVANMPNIGDSDETFLKKAEFVRNKLRTNREKYLSNLEKGAGKDVSQFRSPQSQGTEPASGGKKVIDPATGKIHLIPDSDVDAAVKAGGKIVG